MTVLQIDRRIKKLKKQLDNSGDGWSSEEGNLIHDIDLLKGMKLKLERIEEEKKLLKSIEW